MALQRDGYRCQCKGCAGCGDGCGRAGILQVDHKVPLDVAPERMYDLTNLQTLCADPCHFAKTLAENQTPVDPERAAWAAYMVERLNVV